MRQSPNDIVLVEGNNELNVQLVPIALVGIEVTSITLDKSKLLAGEGFTISITFSNPSDSDVWVRPRFAFGKIVDSVFTPEKVLCGWDYFYNVPYDQAYIFDWVDLGPLQHPGSNMSNIIYPDYGMSYAYLKVPAKGQATTARLWYTSSSRWPTSGKLDLYVETIDALYLIWDDVEGRYVIKKYELPIIGAVRNAVDTYVAFTVREFRLWLEKPRAYASMKVINNTGTTYPYVVCMMTLQTEGGKGISHYSIEGFNGTTNWRQILPGTQDYPGFIDFQEAGYRQEVIDEWFKGCSGQAVVELWFQSAQGPGWKGTKTDLAKIYLEGVVEQDSFWSPSTWRRGQVLPWIRCPQCGSSNVSLVVIGYYGYYLCEDCGYEWR